MEQKADAVVAHALSGRVRLRIPAKRGDSGYFEEVLAAASGCEGLRKLVINPATGSVLIHYDAGRTGALNDFLENNTYFRVLEETQPPPPPPVKVERDNPGTKTGKQQDALPMELSQAIGLGLIGWSCYRLLQDGFKSPPWHAALWYGVTLLRGGPHLPATKQDSAGEK
ncbi:MAG: HMA2 domain-containing protein [Thermodesulfobacteriota bacterium]